MGIEIGWWAPNPGRPRGGVEGYTEGHGTPAGADIRYLLEQLGASPRDGARRSLPPTVGTTVDAEPCAQTSVDPSCGLVTHQAWKERTRNE
jgi:hypothetical protein